MFKAVWRYAGKSGAVTMLFIGLIAMSTMFSTASVADAAVTGTVTTTHWKMSSGEGYTLNFTVPDDGTVDTVTLSSGPGVTAPVTFTENLNGSTSTFTCALERAVGTPPVTGDVYQLDVTHLDGSPQETINVSVTGAFTTVPTATGPSGAVASAANPTFTWSAPQSTVYKYQVTLSGSDSTWTSAELANSTSQYTFATTVFATTDRPSATAPTAGIKYDWIIAARDANGNRAETHTPVMFGANFTGTVKNLNGVGVEGVSVMVYLATTGQVKFVDDIVTDADGNYMYGGLPTGSYNPYKVKFIKGNSSVYYNNQLDWDNATQLILTANVVSSNVNVVLDGWGDISGKALNAAYTGLSGVKVELYDTNGARVSSVASATTDNYGDYTLSLIPVGNYKVKMSATGYADAWIDGGNAIAVTAGQTTAATNTQLLSLNLSGKVTNLSGTPVAGVTVYLFTDKTEQGMYFNFPGVKTQADGSYNIGGVAAGTYYIMYDTYGTSYLKQYYNRKGAIANADAVVIPFSGAVAGSVDAVLGDGTPVIKTFTVPSTFGSLNVSGIVLAADEGNGIAGYMLTESATPPDAGATGWSTTAPTSYRFSSIGTKTLYAWAKGSTGIVAGGTSRSVNITAVSSKAGDCDDNGSVNIAEVQGAINMYLGITSVRGCVDVNGSNSVDISEVQKAINSFLGL